MAGWVVGLAVALVFFGAGHIVATRRSAGRVASLESTIDQGIATASDLGRQLAASRDELTRSTRALEARSLELAETRRRAARSDQAKREFLANISHEIRTPLTAIVGMTDLVLDTAPNDEQARYLRAVKTSADHLHALVNDILDVSKIEAGRLELDPVAFRLRETVGDSLELLARQAHAKGLELVHDIATSVPDFVIGDPGRLRQILLNLVGNAIKFTARGEVVVGVTADARGADSVELRWTVRDTGIGIDVDKQDTIFAAFEQADGSTTRRYGGTGLGLAISAHLVELMGGRIGLDSTPGAGTSFHFTTALRTQAQPTTRPTLTPPAAIRGRRALVVDDNDAARQATVRILSAWDLRVDDANCGDAALKQTDAARDGCDPYTLILLDAYLVPSDGFEIADRLASAGSGTPPVIMMLPTHDLHRDLARCRAHGVAATVTKPATHRSLLGAVTRALGVDDAAVAVARQRDDAGPGPRRSLRVLVAEDHELNQDLIGTLLRKRGHSSIVVGSGRAALDALAAEDSAFDAVLMDVQMPDMDGLDATRAIRQREGASGRHIAVIGITAGVHAEERNRCLEAGMDLVVAKPIDADRLFEAIEGCAVSRRERPSTAMPGPIPDQAELIRRLGGDGDLLVRMIEAFLGDLPRTMGALEVAIRRQDARALEHAAHRLRGAAGHFGASAVVASAEALERVGRHGDLTNAEHLLDELMAATGDLCAALGRIAESRDDAPRSRTA